jgi:hypothetical protein
VEHIVTERLKLQQTRLAQPELALKTNGPKQQIALHKEVTLEVYDPLLIIE